MLVVKKYSYLVLILILFVQNLLGQSSKGKEFWMGFMDGGGEEISLVIFSEVDTKGVISIPKQNWDTTFSVSANNFSEVFFKKNQVMPVGSEKIHNKGIHISSEDSITVYSRNWSNAWADWCLLYPIEFLGLNYSVLTHAEKGDNTSVENGDLSEFTVVATEDSSEIEISPSVETLGGYPPNSRFVVKLDKGELYQVQSKGNLTGSTISTLSCCKRIAVFSGSPCTNVNNKTCCCDHLYEQILPNNLTGDEFVVIPFTDNSVPNTLIRIKK